MLRSLRFVLSEGYIGDIGIFFHHVTLKIIEFIIIMTILLILPAVLTIALLIGVNEVFSSSTTFIDNCTPLLHSSNRVVQWCWVGLILLGVTTAQSAIFIIIIYYRFFLLVFAGLILTHVLGLLKIREIVWTIILFVRFLFKEAGWQRRKLLEVYLLMCCLFTKLNCLHILLLFSKSKWKNIIIYMTFVQS